VGVKRTDHRRPRHPQANARRLRFLSQSGGEQRRRPSIGHHVRRSGAYRSGATLPVRRHVAGQASRCRSGVTLPVLRHVTGPGRRRCRSERSSLGRENSHGRHDKSARSIAICQLAHVRHGSDDKLPAVPAICHVLQARSLTGRRFRLIPATPEAAGLCLGFQDFAVQVEQHRYVTGRDSSHPAFGTDPPRARSGRRLGQRGVDQPHLLAGRP
jgi:hypothetical protein